MTNEHAYFIPTGDDVYTPTEHSGGAWRDDELHLAPVAGLVVHHMERWRQDHVHPSLVFSRFSFEVLGQIAREPITLSTEVVRPGRTIQLIETTAVIAGRVTIRARGWLLQTSDTAEVVGDEFDPLPAPETLPEFPLTGVWGGGFIRSLRPARRTEDSRPGRARVWLTSDHPLVAGETSTELASFARLLDTANGIAARQDPTEWMFPNVDWTLHFFRSPRLDGGEPWVGFDTRANFGPTGIGLTSSVLHDVHGPVGTLQQSLTVRRLG